jgi:MFS family permease
MTTIQSSQPVFHTSVTGMLPVVGSVFLGFLAVGLPLAALPIEMQTHFRYGPTTIGATIGLQSLTTLVTRHRAGTLCDQRGPQRAVLIGLPVAALSGLAYLLAGSLPFGPTTALAILIIGRLVMGLGESLFLTGLMSWGIARLGADRTGKVMSWTGIAIYAALGLGAPLGLALQSTFGFVGVGCAVVLAPLLAWTIAVVMSPVAAAGGNRVAFHRVLALIWRPGMILALSTVPFAVIVAFLALQFSERNWAQPGAALFGFGLAYVLVRLVASGLPDRLGAARVAIGSLVFEALGQVTLWLAPNAAVAVFGATMTGIGFSLIFPAMGVLATRSVAPELRGRAVGNFIAFADIALGVTGPAVGFAVQRFGTSSAFLVGALSTLVALGLLQSVRLGRSS